MELHEIVIRPEGPFGTPIRGDTLFGQFCWQIEYDPSLVRGDLPSNIALYSKQPFIVFSSAFPRLESTSGQVTYALKRPNFPLSWLFRSGDNAGLARIRDLKLNKSRKWMIVTDDLRLDPRKALFLSDEELFNKVMHPVGRSQPLLEATHPVFRCTRVHNTIHRITGTTGSGEFAPYNREIDYYVPGIKLAIFVLIDPSIIDVGAVEKGLKRIGRIGFGMDASIGMGRFSIDQSRKINAPQPADSAGIYCLSPTVPVPDSYEHAYFTPFVRFGKHGDTLARSDNPFKNPVIMADEGAVFVPKDSKAFARPYWGRSVTNVSMSMPNTVVQGYSIWLPIYVDLRGEA